MRTYAESLAQAITLNRYTLRAPYGVTRFPSQRARIIAENRILIERARREADHVIARRLGV